MRIRPATPNELSAIAAVHAASWRDAYRDMLPDDYLDHQVSDDLARQWRDLEIGPRDVVLVAEQETVVGFIAVWCRPDPYIDNLHVLPQGRSGGIGKKLMQAAAERLVRQGQSTAYLWVLADNHHAIRFYERLGGERAERTDKAIFGHELPNFKIVWSDISTMLPDDQSDGSGSRPAGG